MIDALAALALVSAADFDRPALLDAAPAERRTQIAAAPRHVLIVRHARKISEDCDALDCALSDEGAAMVARLAGLIGPVPVDAAYASSACRAVYTAAAGGRPPLQHQPASGLTQGCETGIPVARTREDALADTRDGQARWTLV
ncbi:MAG: histidine phosphatase family protein, partial [Oceanicaulis sp.]